MEELQPEELQGLVQELEGESREEEALSPEVEELLRDLQQSSAWMTRLKAAEDLGELSESSSLIVQSLITAGKSDSSLGVRDAAMESLRASVHQEYVRQYPDLLEATEGVLQELRVLQRSRDERPRRPKKRRRRPKTTAEQAAIQRERQRGEQREKQRELQRAIEDCEVHSRKEPKVGGEIAVLIAFGVLWIGIVAANLAIKEPCLFALLALPGVALVTWGLLRWRAATVHRDVLLRSMKETVGTVEDLRNEEHKDDYGRMSYTYYVTVSFEAEDVKVGTRVMALKASVSRDVWKGLIEDQSVRIRYAAEDPTIVLFQWEW